MTGGALSASHDGASSAPRLIALAASHHLARHAADPLAFHPHFPAWAAAGALALGYTLGIRRVVRTGGPVGRPSRRHIAYLVTALVALLAALTWPLADLAAHWSLTALVVQRLLLTLLVAPLLLMAAPAPLLGMLTRPAPVDACVRALTRPPVAVVVFTVVAIGTLVSPAVAAQASSGWWRGATDVALLLAGLVLWAPTMRHLPGVHRTVPVGLAAYLFVQSVVPTFPAVIYVFARHPLYPAFSGVHQALGLSRIVDQQLAGIVAKVATLPVLWSAAWAALSRAQRLEAVEAEEPLTWAEVERQLERAARAERQTHPRLLERLRAGPGRDTPPDGHDAGHAPPRSPADGPGSGGP
ncbi:MAG: cytochrome c oxidase assembly protein [Acidimicrobiales bacterium]